MNKKAQEESLVKLILMALLVVALLAGLAYVLRQAFQ